MSPVFVIAPDDAAAEGLARDLDALTGEAVTILTSREFTFYSAESVSRQAVYRSDGPCGCFSISASIRRRV